MKTIQITVEVEVPDEVDYTDIASWVNCHIDNIPYEELINFENISLENADDIDIDYGVTPVFSENLRFNHNLISYYSLWHKTYPTHQLL